MIDEPFPAAFNCRRALGQLVDERKQTPDQNRLAGKHGHTVTTWRLYRPSALGYGSWRQLAIRLLPARNLSSALRDALYNHAYDNVRFIA